MKHAARLRAAQRRDSAQWARDKELIQARVTRLRKQGVSEREIEDSVARSLNVKHLEARRRIDEAMGGS